MLHRTARRMKKSAFEFWAEGLVRKISYSLPHKLTVTGNPPTQSLSVWRGKWGQMAFGEAKVAFPNPTLTSSRKAFPNQRCIYVQRTSDLVLKTFQLIGVCFEQQSLRPLLTVAYVSVLERRRVARKKLLGGAKKLKKLFERKK